VADAIGQQRLRSRISAGNYMSPLTINSLVAEFHQTLEECKRLYASSGREVVQSHLHLLKTPTGEFLDMMGDLHKGLVIKVYVELAEADGRWSAEEKQLAQVLFEHVWHRSLAGEQLREAVQHVSNSARQLQWCSLVQPFNQIAPLRARIGRLKTLVMRLANIVAKAEGVVLPVEAAALSGR
jgi:tellurite resistance protein